MSTKKWKGALPLSPGPGLHRVWKKLRALSSLQQNPSTSRRRLAAAALGMWKNRKRKDAEEAGGGDGEIKPPKKTFKKDDDGSDDIVVCDTVSVMLLQLSKNRRVSIRIWLGKVVVDIREFYTKDGKELPGKKGISLTMDQWKILRDHVDDIDKAVAENA
ncbi:hypothetical protein ACLOJK_014037 [Asimina triloba]